MLIHHSVHSSHLLSADGVPTQMEGRAHRPLKTFDLVTPHPSCNGMSVRPWLKG